MSEPASKIVETTKTVEPGKTVEQEEKATPLTPNEDDQPAKSQTVVSKTIEPQCESSFLIKLSFRHIFSQTTGS